MSHRVVFLGAGYAGLPAAERLANQVFPDEVEVVVLTESPVFVERPRLHQLATGQTLRDLPLDRFFSRSGVRLRIGRAVSIDRVERRIEVLGGAGREDLTYDTLVYAAGSSVDLDAVPGVRRHAHAVNGPAASERIHDRLQHLHRHGGVVAVCGGGLTGIEVAAEIAERFPRLEVRLLSSGEPGGRLSEPARRYLRRTFDRLGVAVTGRARVRKCSRRRLQLSDGSRRPVRPVRLGGRIHRSRPRRRKRACRWTTAVGSSPTARCGRSATPRCTRSATRPPFPARGARRWPWAAEPGA